MIEPSLKRIGEQYNGRVDVWKVNADEHPELLRKLRIYSIPTRAFLFSPTPPIKSATTSNSTGIAAR